MGSESPEEKRVGDWRQTYSGRMYWPCDPRFEEVHVEDVAHHLALTNRFGGAAAAPYSVAEHCVRASLLLENLGHRDLALEGLFHDAAEGLIGMDVIRPVKRSGILGLMITDLENRNQREVHKRFGLPDRFREDVVEWDHTTDDSWQHFFDPKEMLDVRLRVLRHDMPAPIAKVDDIMLMTEARDLMAPPPMPWRESGNKPLPERIVPMTASQAEYHWLNRFNELTNTAA